MLGIIKKDFFIYSFYFLLGIASTVYLYIKDGMDEGLIMMFGIMLHIMILGSQAFNEKLEDKNSGYDFLKNLPVGPADIVRGKLLLGILFIVLYSTYTLFMLGFLSPNQNFLYF